MLTYARQTILSARAFEGMLCLFKLFFAPGTSTSQFPDAPVIALIEPFNLGDLLSLAVMLDPILDRFPDAHIVIVCHSRTAQVYQSDPRVWKVIDARFPWSNRTGKRGTRAEWRSVLRAIRHLRSLRPDAAIDTRGDVRSQALLLLAGCKRRIGYTTYANSNLHLRGLLLNHAIAYPPTPHRYLANLFTLTALQPEAPRLHLPALHAPTPEHSVPGPGVVLIHPGGGWIHKLWPQSRWATLIERLQQLPSIHPILIAGPGELPLAEEINRTLRCSIPIHSPSYPELLALISNASLFIGLDSGPMNAAVLLNIPVIALFGPGESSAWRPLSQGSRFFHYIEDYACHPCIQGSCVRPNDSCMTKIMVSEVFEAAKAILRQLEIPQTEEAAHSGRLLSIS